MASQGDLKLSRKSRSRQVSSWESLGHREQQLARMQDADFEKWQAESKELERKAQQRREKLNQVKSCAFSYPLPRASIYEEEYDRYLSGQDLCGPVSALGGSKRSRDDRLKTYKYVQDEVKQTDSRENKKTLKNKLCKPIPVYALSEKKYKVSGHQDSHQVSRSSEESRYKNDTRKQQYRDTSTMSLESYRKIEEEKLRVRNLPSLLDLKISCPRTIGKMEEQNSTRPQDLKSTPGKREKSLESNSKYQDKYYSTNDQELKGKSQDCSHKDKYLTNSQRNVGKLVKQQDSELRPVQWRERMNKVESTRNIIGSEYSKKCERETQDNFRSSNQDELRKRGENNHYDQVNNLNQISKSYYTNSSNAVLSHKNKKTPHTEITRDEKFISSDNHSSAFAAIPQKLKQNQHSKDNYQRNRSSKDYHDNGRKEEIQNCDLREIEPKKCEKSEECLRIRANDYSADSMVVPNVEYSQSKLENLEQPGVQEKKIPKAKETAIDDILDDGTKPQVSSVSSQFDERKLKSFGVNSKNLKYKPESSGYGSETEERVALKAPSLRFKADPEPFEISLGRGGDRRRKNGLDSRRKGLKEASEPETEHSIQLNFEADRGIFEYELKFSPEINSREIKLFLLGQLKFHLGDTMILDDTTLYLPLQLPQQVMYAVHPYDDSRVEVVLKLRGQRQAGGNTHVFNLLLKKILVQLRLSKINGDPDVPQLRLENWSANVKKVEECEGGVRLIFDTLPQTPTVLEMINKIHQQHQQDWEAVVKSTLVGCFLYTSFNQRLYQMNDIDFSSNPLSTFTGRDGEEMSYVDYYSKQFSLHIKDLEQPLLVSNYKKKKGTEQVIVLVPELSYLLEDKTNDKTKELRIHQHQDDLRNNICCFQKNKTVAELLKPWGLSICVKYPEQDLNTSHATSENKTSPSTEIHTFQKAINPDTQIDSVQLTSNVNDYPLYLDHWAIVYSHHDTQYVSNFLHNMMQAGPFYGINISKPYMVMVKSENIRSYMRTLRKITNPQLQTAVWIIRPACKDLYATIKKACSDNLSIYSQIIPSSALVRVDIVRTIAQKTVLEIYWHLPSTLQRVPLPYKGCMVVGISKLHEIKYSKIYNVIGVVASLNTSLSHWYTKVSTKIELLDSVAVCVTQALYRYKELNNKLPEHILLFQDGAAVDGQPQLKNEMEKFKSSISQVYCNYHPMLTYILVQKNIGIQRLSHFSPVDHFTYLVVSQSRRDATLTPTSCVITYDDSGVEKGHMQLFTSLLCHMSQRSPGNIIKPAPCQYAYKLAQLVNRHIKTNDQLSSSNKIVSFL